MGKEYTVKKVLERTRLTQTGTLEKYYRIEAETARGTPFTADLTEEQAAPDRAAGILSAKAASLDQLLKL